MDTIMEIMPAQSNRYEDVSLVNMLNNSKNNNEQLSSNLQS